MTGEAHMMPGGRGHGFIHELNHLSEPPERTPQIKIKESASFINCNLVGTLTRWISPEKRKNFEEKPWRALTRTKPSGDGG
jgi:hypothetical protein